MGTDIHCYVEKKREDNSGWDQLGLWIKDPETGSFKEAEFYDGRNYLLFGMLAGVRSGTEPIAALRGIPEDMSDGLVLEYGKGEWFHDATWYDYYELADYLKGRNDAMFLVDELEKSLKTKVRDAEDDYEGEAEDHFLLRGVEEEREEIEALKEFVAAIDDVLWKYSIYYPKFGQIRITMWFDS